MEFNEEQQKAIDKMISRRVAEIKTKHEAELAEKIAEAKAEADKEVTTLKAEVEQLKAREGESNDRIRRALLKAEVAGTSAVNTDQVLKLVDEDFTLGEDGTLRVVDGEGNTRLDEAGSPLSVKAYLEGFLTDNPHLARSTPRTGSGSVGATWAAGMVGGRTKTRGEFDAMDPAQKTNYIRSGGTLAD